MSPVSPIPAITSLFAVCVTIWLIIKQYGAPSLQGRYASIDGLRGYLAFFVFLHHSSIWYYYLRSGRWGSPPSNLYIHFGQTSVKFFFMITGFLFYSKLIDGRAKSIDWLRLFVSRVTRLAPLYLFSIFIMLIIVAILSKATLNEPLPSLIKNIAIWLSFTVVDMPNINAVPFTKSIDAGVTWSLVYEWFFYFSLPVLALSVRLVPPLPYLILSLAGMSIVGFYHPEVVQAKAFISGIAAAFLVRNIAFKSFAISKIASICALTCLAVVIIYSPTADGFIPLTLLTVVFVIIASGNSFFGVLTHSISRTLGEVTYSIYLLHGIVLFVLFRFIIGYAEARQLSVFNYWIIIIGISPILIILCFITFKCIESPAMNSTNKIVSWMRARTLAGRANVQNKFLR